MLLRSLRIIIHYLFYILGTSLYILYCQSLITGHAMQNLKKVDFIWINRDQKSFEWFLNLLSMIEADQQVEDEYNCNIHTGQFYQSICL